MSIYKGNAYWAGTCYGVDLQGDRPVAVCAEKKYRNVSCKPVSFDNIPEDAVVVSFMPVRESLTRGLKAPFPSVSKAEKILPTLLDVELPFALEECVYSFIDMTGGKSETTALAVAARSVDVEKKLELLKEHKIDPLILDHEGLALWTQSLRELDVSDGARAVVYLGVDRCVVVIGQGSKFISSHSVRENDASQIHRILKATLRQGSNVKWFWAGPKANDASFVSSIRNQLQENWSGSSVVHDDPETFLSRALAVRALQGGALPCNLRTAKHTHPVMAKRAVRQSMKTPFVFLLAGMLLCAVSLTWNFIVSQKQERLGNSFSVLADKIAGYHLREKGDHALGTIQNILITRSEARQPFLEVFEPSLLEMVLQITVAGKEKGLQFEILSLSKDKVQVNGTADGWTNTDSLLAIMKEAGMNAKIDKQDALDDGRIPFSLSGKRETVLK